MALQLLAGVWIVEDGKVLLIQQKPEGDQANKWGPPAGHGEGSEKPLDVAIRETKEETNLDIEIEGILQSGVFHYLGKDYAIVMYKAKAKNLQDIKIQDAEVQSYRWVSRQEITNGKYPIRKKFLTESLLKAFDSPLAPIDSFKVFELEKD